MLGSWATWGMPDGRTSVNYPPGYGQSTPSVSGSYHLDESRDYDYPNFNGPNVRKWGGKAGRALSRAVR